MSPVSEHPDEMQQLIHALRRYAEAADRTTEAAGHLRGLHRTDLRALAILMQRQADGQDTTPKDLGHLLNLTSASTTALVDRLVTHGHAERRPSATDRRSVIVRHTRRATADGRAVFAPLGEHLAERLAGFSPAQMATAVEVVTAAAAALDEVDFPQPVPGSPKARRPR